MTGAADFAGIAATVRASTVRVHDYGRGYGAGIVWRTDGTILSNAHVVRGRKAIVEFETGRTLPAEIVKRDDRRDLALLRVADTDGLVAAEVRASSSVAAGELVIAVGNPHGLRGLVTAGLVQRCNSRWVIANVRLAPGNSGGPLADAWGRVVGINAMVARGLALAVPSDAATAFVNGTSARRLGVALVRTAPGLLVTGIEPGSIAERAGLLLGDAILADDVITIRASDALDIVRAGAPMRIELPWAGESRAA